MRVRNEECFVLRTIPIKESSLVVDIFTRNYGRISLMAKGARRKKSEFRGTIRPFQLLMVSWSGKNELPIMTKLVNKETPFGIGGRQVYCSYYLNELIIRFLRQAAPHRELFDIYRTTLNDLNDSENQFHVLRVFEKNLLKFLGYQLVLKTESDGKTPIRSDKLYHYDFESGPIPATHPGNSSVTGNALLAIEAERFNSSDIRQESLQFLRMAIEHYCEGNTNRSREVFRQTVQIER